jgi:hypothetical protein
MDTSHDNEKRRNVQRQNVHSSVIRNPFIPRNDITLQSKPRNLRQYIPPGAYQVQKELRIKSSPRNGKMTQSHMGKGQRHLQK